MLYVNDEAQREDYVIERPTYAYGPSIVPEGCVFVLGDNRRVCCMRLLFFRVGSLDWPVSTQEPFAGLAYMGPSADRHRDRPCRFSILAGMESWWC